MDDGHMGPITKTVHDCAVAFHAMGGTAADLKSTDIRGMRSAAGQLLFDKLDLEVSESVRKAVQTRRRWGSHCRYKSSDVDAMNVIARVLLLAEATSVHHENLVTRRTILEPTWSRCSIKGD